MIRIRRLCHLQILINKAGTRGTSMGSCTKFPLRNFPDREGKGMGLFIIKTKLEILGEVINDVIFNN